MKNNWIFAVALCCGLLLTSIGADDSTTQKVETSSTQAQSTEPPTTTPKPKVDILNSDLCKKCACDKDVRQIDCTARNLSKWFSDDEWSTLQNGDLTFEIIKMEHNNLTEIPVLPPYPVKSLYLGFNQIAEIALGAFSNLTELAKLDLSHNKLTSKAMLPDVFRGKYSPTDYLPLDHMVELDLGYNDLHNLHSDLFEHLPKLEVLILCNNVFQVIDHMTEIAIAGLTSLKTLDMSYMELDDLPDTMFHGPRDLENLILTGNLFEEVPDNMELGINLKRLVLDENLMTDFEGDNVFPAFKSLQYLSISYMPELKRIGKGAFKDLQNLNELILANNPKLSYIDAEAFSRPTANPLILDFPPLDKLYLHNNNLSVLEHDLFERWDKIEVIDLRYNPWHCDCANSWLIHTLMTQINTTSPVLTKNVECQTPAAWKDLALMTINGDKKQLLCENSSHPEHDGVVLGSLLVGILVGIPLTLGAVILYRRGCFGLRDRVNPGSRSLYNRASFTDDFHI